MKLSTCLSDITKSTTFKFSFKSSSIVLLKLKSFGFQIKKIVFYV